MLTRGSGAWQRQRRKAARAAQVVAKAVKAGREGAARYSA